MAEYRIIKRSMFDVIGSVSYRGYHDVYSVQKKTWYGWKDIKGADLCVTLEQAQNLLELAKVGKLYNGYEVIE